MLVGINTLKFVATIYHACFAVVTPPNWYLFIHCCAILWLWFAICQPALAPFVPCRAWVKPGSGFVVHDRCRLFGYDAVAD